MGSRTKRCRVVFCAVFLLSLVLSIQKLPAQTTVRIAFNGFGGVAPLYLGQETGIFKKQGLNLELVFIPGGSLSLQALIGKSLDLLMSENGLATDKGLKVMVETLGTAVGKNVDFPPERLVDYTLLKEVQKEMGIQ